ncbi:MAG TPA: hypothetical protein VM689_00900 [Aliidongia sp.]|nr:hypothetical protein [Aliidongia sp.]
MAEEDRKRFEAVAETLRADVTMAASTVTWDAHVRQLYQRTISATVNQLRAEAQAGRISWHQAAEQASALRNDTMEILRTRSSPTGLAIAQAMKKEGLTFNGVVAKYTKKLFGEAADFTRLSQAEQESVYAAVIAAAGRSNPRVNAMLLGASRIGRGLLILSLAVSVYDIATSDDPVHTAEKEGAVTGAGILGGVAGGAAAGLVCGPGAPVCVGVGAFVGGALAAFGVSWFW